jgi:hypothetical protein
MDILCTFDTYVLLPFGIFCGTLAYFPRFGILYQEKYGSPFPKERVPSDDFVH